MKIMLIRHFATPGNEKRQYIGSTDEVLCTNGKADLGYGFIRVSYRFGTFDERV